MAPFVSGAFRQRNDSTYTLRFTCYVQNMTNLDDIRSSFESKLDERTQQRKTRLNTELAALREQLLRQAKTALPADIANRLAGFDERIKTRRSGVSGGPPVLSHLEVPGVQALLDISRADQLRQLDNAFAEIFNLSAYYPLQPLKYPTVYCESLEEFFIPIVGQLNLSPQARKTEMERLMAEAQRIAQETNGGGILGYNLPGQGCYLNGWLFVYGRNLPPRAAFEHPELLRRVLGTAAHEKLGHGFLSAYSALGQTKVELGISLLEIARRFGARPSDDPVASLRQEQAELLNMASQLLEEGWATWVETFLAANLMESGVHPRHSIEAIVQAIENLPGEIPERGKIQGALYGALELLFGEEDVPIELIHQAVMTVEMLGSQLDAYFGSALGQPLRYAAGELIMVQAGANLGPVCVPYAVLIAANVSFDPEEISLSDLREMFATKPNLNPDARLAALSRMRLEQTNSVSELAGRAESELSFSVPKELKRKA